MSVVGSNPFFDFEPIKRLEFFPGLMLTQVSFFAPNDETTEVRIDDSFLEFSFHLSGSGRGNLSNGLKSYCEVPVGPATSLVSYNPGATCRIQVKGGERFKVLNIYMAPKLLGDLLGDELGMVPGNLKAIVSGGNVSPFNFVDTLDPAMKMIIEQIMNCSHQGALEKIYLESKALELIVCRLARFKVDSRFDLKRLELGPKDVDRIHEAKDRLMERMDNPPSLSALARQVGVNTTKLSKGFQNVFGTTAYELLRKERVTQARQTLETKAMNITETAHHFGYSDASHFIREFVKFYGTTPGTYLKTFR